MHGGTALRGGPRAAGEAWGEIPGRAAYGQGSGKAAPAAAMSGGSGGSGAVGGFAFQARIGAIAGVHLLRGMPVQWTDDLTGAAPRAVSFETSGPGGDLSLELADGSIVEVQAKKGLRADGRFWSALEALCEGVHAESCAFGLLLVCPDASGMVRRHYARALRRIGDGRKDNAPAPQAKLLKRLEGRGYDAARICARIRIKTVSALEDAGDAVAAARAELAHVCARDEQVGLAWKALCQDAQSAMENQGRRTLQSLTACLRVSHIKIQDAIKDSPVAVRHALLRWSTARTEHFEVLGIGRLPTDVAWLPLRAIIGDASDEPATSVEEALARYRALGEKSGVGVNEIDARTIGSFRGLCVVVGGPGSGKSLLLRVLARELAKDSYPSVRVRLRELATRVRETGCGVEAGLLQLGLDGTGVSPEQARVALPDLVLLCDGARRVRRAPGADRRGSEGRFRVPPFLAHRRDDAAHRLQHERAPGLASLRDRASRQTRYRAARRDAGPGRARRARPGATGRAVGARSGVRPGRRCAGDSRTESASSVFRRGALHGFERSERDEVRAVPADSTVLWTMHRGSERPGWTLRRRRCATAC